MTTSVLPARRPQPAAGRGRTTAVLAAGRWPRGHSGSGWSTTAAPGAARSTPACSTRCCTWAPWAWAWARWSTKHGTASLGGVSYLAFLAPGLLAAAAMQTAMGESTYPVLASVKWLKTYQAAAATPLRPADLFHGHLLFTTMRLTMNSAIFLVMMAAFGAVQSAWVVAAMPGRVLTGLAFAAPIEAFAVTQRKDQDVRGAVPVRDDPAVPVLGHVLPGHPAAGLVRPVAYATPLWHGVALCRAAQPGHRGPRGRARPRRLPGLVCRLLAGLVIGQRTYRRRLYV